jgi:hypothetical protein
MTLEESVTAAFSEVAERIALPPVLVESDVVKRRNGRARVRVRFRAHPGHTVDAITLEMQREAIRAGMETLTGAGDVKLQLRGHVWHLSVPALRNREVA